MNLGLLPISFHYVTHFSLLKNISIGVLMGVLYDQLFTVCYIYALRRRAGGVFAFGLFKAFSSL